MVHSNGNTKIVEDGIFRIDQSPQILHLADWCNECGNCNTFCPTSGAPYKEKPHLYLNKSAFETDDDCYFLNGDTLHYKHYGQISQLKEKNDHFEYITQTSKIRLSKNDFSILDFEIKTEGEVDLSRAAEMKMILFAAQNFNGHNSPFPKEELLS